MSSKLAPAGLALIAAFLGAPEIGLGATLDIPLKQVQGPKNSINDAQYGVSMTYPDGWELARAFRWGDNQEKTTLGLRRNWPTVANVSFFYQKFTPDSPRPPKIETWFRDAYRGKEAVRQKEASNYRNDPKSLSFATTATGLPKCSYQATFTGRSGKMVELYVRVAGIETYVMFIAQAPPGEIDAIRADIDRMADTVRLP